MRTITKKLIDGFEESLKREEKSRATVEKYMRDLRAFATWAEGRRIDKSCVVAYKDDITQHYATASVNSMLSALNSFFEYCEWHELHVKTLRVQRSVFACADGVLTRTEYERLLCAAQEKNERLYWLMQTVCACGLRVSELRYITVEALRSGRAEIANKGKLRYAFLPTALCRALKKYAKERGIASGAVFVTRSGNVLDRSNIWSDMKRLCEAAGVSPKKVFPHNLRHLFARTFYRSQKDIVRLADILGHSSINTTRIYTMETGEIHRRQIQALGLLHC